VALKDAGMQLRLLGAETTQRVVARVSGWRFWDFFYIVKKV